MSTSAAIRALPSKKLTTTAPQAGVARKEPGGTTGLSTLPLRRQNVTAATTPTPSSQGPAGDSTSTCGSALANARITPPSATASSSAPTTSTSFKVVRH